jgi:hypothetical protein
MNLERKLEELERRADAVLNDREPDDSGVVFYLPDNGRGDGPPVGRHGNLVMFDTSENFSEVFLGS